LREGELVVSGTTSFRRPELIDLTRHASDRGMRSTALNYFFKVKAAGEGDPAVTMKTLRHKMISTTIERNAHRINSKQQSARG